METNKKPTILIYTGDCAELAKLFEIEKNKKVFVKRSNLEVKKGTEKLLYPVQEWGYYPIEFKCDNKPSGVFYGGDLFGAHGIIKKVE